MNINISKISPFLKRIYRFVTAKIRGQRKLLEFRRLKKSRFPNQIMESIVYLINSKMDADTKMVVSRAETRRNEIYKSNLTEIPILYSPKPGSFTANEYHDAKPKPGKKMLFTSERIATTGKDKKWGTVLYLIARANKSKYILELGSCAGISGIYLASSPSLEYFVTIEGSKELSEISKRSLNEIKKAEVWHCLFDEAIDKLVKDTEIKFDLVFIDGHHEKAATIHYFDKLLPILARRCIVIFDDISWSADMRDAWNQLSTRSEFSHSIDLGTIGVCILKDSVADEDTPKIWNLQPITGMVNISKPHGWRS